MILERRYPVIYADPPWKFAAYSEKGEGRSAVAHYDCMTMDQLFALRVQEIASDDAVLFLWTTDPFLQMGMKLIEAWGFKFKTVAFYWAKIKKRRTLIRFLREISSLGSDIGQGQTLSHVYSRREVNLDVYLEKLDG